MTDYGLFVRLPTDFETRRAALARLLGAAAVLDEQGRDATWQPHELPRRGTVTVPGGVDRPCEVGMDTHHLWLLLDAAIAQSDPRVDRWLDAVSRRVGLAHRIGLVVAEDRATG